MSLRNWFLLVVLGAIWGGSFLFAKIAVAEIPPFILVFFRVSIACTALWCVVWWRGLSKHFTPKLLPAFFMMGLMNNAIPFSLLFLGQTGIGAGLASILNATTPIFTVIVASFLTNQEQPQLNKIIGVVLGIASVGMMLSGSLTGLANDPVWAQLCCVGAAISYACGATFAKRFSHLPPTVSATGQLTGSTLIMLPVAVFAGSGWSISEPSALTWLNVLALGLLATAIAYLIYFRLLAEAGATNASLVTLLVPASALFLGWMLLGEQLSTVQIAGFAVLLVGLAVLDGRIFPKRSAEPQR
ncbi:DMT family transporter [Roseibium denhamense]|uniref:Permease of the drug/metabolite transporter (DMT) superfamily n=1 Tax=Roseibium denhamense TaxID=76305 RepID=A0ABY1NLX3_9HYPH|nr:DMT family transporter [Roseibium denhamense]MTI06759.1 DMT family transporter [Roseibium denhamense]SMP11077.1 Permease of the drug/metabolite transporter (DMT) superfamily [Roseibium denhamense]